MDLIRLRRKNHPQPALFCSRPFRTFEPGLFPKRGEVYLCCREWLPKSVGNMTEQSVSEIWNGERAREVRRSILDGSFEHCTSYCPHLQTITGPVQKIEDVTDPELKEIIEKKLETLPHGPRNINTAFDSSCNLACPSCRPSRVVETHAKNEILGMQAKLEAEGFHDVETLYMTGSGDPFGSPYFLAWLKRLRIGVLPKLKHIHLHTNAQLWTPRVWAKIDENVRALVKSTEISIDASTEETYALNRKGGKWERLQTNLEFISGLRKKGPLADLKIHMVVQENNFHEMPAFIDMGRRFGADSVYFSQLADWKTFSPSEQSRRSIHDPLHPRHNELLLTLTDRRFLDRIVDLGNLTHLRTA